MNSGKWLVQQRGLEHRTADQAPVLCSCREVQLHSSSPTSHQFSCTQVRVEQVAEIPVDCGDGVPHLEHGEEHQGVRPRAVHRDEDNPHVLIEAVRPHEAVCPRERYTHQVPSLI